MFYVSRVTIYIYIHLWLHLWQAASLIILLASCTMFHWSAPPKIEKTPHMFLQFLICLLSRHQNAKKTLQSAPHCFSHACMWHAWSEYRVPVPRMTPRAWDMAPWWSWQIRTDYFLSRWFFFAKSVKNSTDRLIGESEGDFFDIFLGLKEVGHTPHL